MAKLELKKYPDPILKQKCLPVGKASQKIRRLLDDMLELMRSSKGVGLAATQVGIMERLVVAEVEGQTYQLINPQVVSASGRAAAEEGCLSLPGVCLEIERAAAVKVTARDKKGKKLTLEAEGLLARVLQHEIDHLDGFLIIDRIPVREYLKLAPQLDKIKEGVYCLGSIAL